MMEKFSKFLHQIVLYEKPNSSFVAQFIGENNQLKGKVKSMNGEICTITTDSGDDIHALKNKCK